VYVGVVFRLGVVVDKLVFVEEFLGGGVGYLQFGIGKEGVNG
jgi:hypothetical protein